MVWVYFAVQAPKIFSIACYIAKQLINMSSDHECQNLGLQSIDQSKILMYDHSDINMQTV